MSEDPTVLTAEEAESLLPEGDEIHNYIQAGPGLLGANYPRDRVLILFGEAESIELGGKICTAMDHPIVIRLKNGRILFFKADMEKLKKFQSEK